MIFVHLCFFEEALEAKNEHKLISRALFSHLGLDDWVHAKKTEDEN